jgi:hypothetical protein
VGRVSQVSRDLPYLTYQTHLTYQTYLTYQTF